MYIYIYNIHILCPAEAPTEQTPLVLDGMFPGHQKAKPAPPGAQYCYYCYDSYHEWHY